MIHFDVTERDGDRELRVEGTRDVVGWIERGRVMQGRRGRYVEWKFTPNGGEAVFLVRDNISEAYDDAREWVRRWRADLVAVAEAVAS